MRENEPQFSIKQHFLLGAFVILAVLLLVIGVVAVRYQTLERTNDLSDRLDEAYLELVEVREQTLLAHAYLLDAAVTHMPESFGESKAHLDAAVQQLDAFDRDYPEYRVQIAEIRHQQLNVAALGVRTMHAYLDQGVVQGNALMEAKSGGLDAQLANLLASCDRLLAEVRAQARGYNESVDMMLDLGARLGMPVAFALLVSNVAFFAWTYRRLHRVLGGEPLQVHQLLLRLASRGISAGTETESSMIGLSRSIEQLLDERELANKALEESELNWRNLVRNLPGGVFRINRYFPYNFEYVSEGMTRLLGRPIAEFVNAHRGDNEFPSAEFAPIRLATIADAIHSNKPYELDYVVVLPDGKRCWIHETGQARFSAGGQLLGLDGILLDHTAVMAANGRVEEVRSQLMSAIESIDIGLLMYDRDGKLVVCNEAFQRLYPGMRPWLIPGWPIVEILRSYYHGADEACRTSHPYEFGVEDETAFIDRWLSGWETADHLKPIRVQDRWVTQERAAGSDGTVVLLRADVTTLVELSNANEEAKRAAEQSNLAKSAFLANMSHEIRTPMNGVLGMTELTLQTELSAEQRENLGMVKSSAEALMVVINDILDFSKIEAGRLDFERIPFSIRSLLADTLHPMRLRADDKGLSLDCAISPEVPDCLLGDPSRIRQIVTNLVGNALKFTDRGEVGVDVECLASEEAGVRLALTVHDSGIGIPGDKLDLIFDPFSQGDTTITRRFGGTGLGLAICKRLAQMMGGRISATSEAGKGSRFRVELRLDIAQAIEPPLAPAASLAGLTALVLDDNPINRTWLTATLAHWGVVPTAVTHYAEAVRQLGSAQFDLVLLDEHLPDGSGLDLLPAVRAAMPQARVWILSSATGKDQRRLCRERGADGYLRKPLSMRELHEILCQGQAPAVAQTSLAQPGNTGKGMRVLLAEDNDVNQKLVERMLQQRQHQITVVSDGAAAVAAVAAKPFDLVLMDMQMPVMDGIEATQAIRAAEAGTGRHLPIIALTANAMAGVREQCMAAGMDGYVSKPIRQEALDAEWARVWAVQAGLAHAPAAAAASENATEAEEGYDPGAALDLFDGDLGFFRSLVEAFEQSADKQLAALRQATDAGDFEAARFAAHAFKGTAGGLNAMALFEQAQAAESAAAAHDVALLRARIADLTAGLAAMRERLRTFLAERAGSLA